jgi:hypothetical protein
MNAGRIVDTLLETKPYRMRLPSQVSDKELAKMPYWERDAIKAHREHMADVRATWGQDKVKPNPQQTQTIQKRWKQNEFRKMLDYTRRLRLNPNPAVASMESDRGELPFGDLVPVGEWEGRLVYHGCSQQDAQSIMKGIEVRPTGGYFGNAFYVADDPKLAKSNYADFADEDAGGAAVLEFTIKPGAHILDLRNDEDTEEWGRVTHRGNDISRSDFHIQMVRQGIDGVFDRSVGGLAVYNPEILDLKGPWQGR